MRRAAGFVRRAAPTYGLALLLWGCNLVEETVVEIQTPTEAALFGLAFAEQGMFAVGEAGTVVHIGPRGEAGDAHSWDLGDSDLRAVSVWVTHRDNVAIVGDGGFFAYGTGDDLESFEWFEIDVGTTADLRDVQFLDIYPAQLVIVGEGVLLRGTELELGVFEWQEPEVTDGEWGSLRSLHLDDWGINVPERALVAVGDNGRVLSADREGLEWTPHEVGTSADLSCVSRLGAFGEQGTWLRMRPGAWELVELDAAADYVACSGALVVSDDQRVHDVEAGGAAILDWQPHALAGLVGVGEGGRAARFAF